MVKFLSKILFLIIFAAGLTWLGQVCLAAPANINELTTPIANQAGYDVGTTNAYTLSAMLGGIVKALLAMAGTIFLIIVFWSGFLWMTASGNEDQVTNAKSKMQMAVTGLVIVIASYSITAVVLLATTNPRAQEVGAQKSTTNSGSAGDFFGGLGSGLADAWNKSHFWSDLGTSISDGYCENIGWGCGD